MNKKFGIIKGMLAFVVAIAMVFGVLPISASVPKALARGGEVTSETLEWSGDMVVNNDVTITGNVTVREDTTLTISEGKTLTVNGDIQSADGYTYSLTVGGSGTLKVISTNNTRGAVAVSSLTVNGATVNVENTKGRGIYIYSLLTVNDGVLIVTSKTDGIISNNSKTF